MLTPEGLWTGLQPGCCQCVGLSPSGWIAVILLLIFFPCLAFLPCLVADCFEVCPATLPAPKLLLNTRPCVSALAVLRLHAVLPRVAVPPRS